LFVLRLGGQLGQHQALARKLRVGAQQSQLPLALGSIEHTAHGVLQLR
jgi:hypothetical protein